jgi:long-chain acyl-CoA synthetase
LQEPLIAQVMVVGDGRNYLTALVVPDRDRLRSWIIANRVPVTSPAEALVHPQVRGLYAEAIARQLASVSNSEQVRRFTLLGRGFTIESGELTPTLKLRRSIVLENFANEVRQMYTADAAPPADCGL